jgi:hypothetical protein
MEQNGKSLGIEITSEMNLARRRWRTEKIEWTWNER